MDSIIENLKYICRYYGLFTLGKKSQIFAIDDCLMHISITSRLLVTFNIDSCGIFKDGIYHCFIYRKLVLLGNRLKFGILNGLPHVDCQSYPPVLADHSMAKEAIIVCAHPVISILKLRPSETFNPIVYSGIKEHIVLFPQNSSSLLILLLFPILALHDIIRIVWAGRRRFTNLGLEHFIQVGK